MRKFLSALYQTEIPAHLVLWTRQDRRAYWFSANDLARVSQRATQLATACDVYLGVGYRIKRQPSRSGALSILVAQKIRPPGGTVRRQEHCPASGQTLSARAQLIKIPTFLPHESHRPRADSRISLSPNPGDRFRARFQPWWLFRELWAFATEPERQAAQTLARRFLATLQHRARFHGWHIDTTSDLARVLRLPGTYNRKLSASPCGWSKSMRHIAITPVTLTRISWTPHQ